MAGEKQHKKKAAVVDGTTHSKRRIRKPKGLLSVKGCGRSRQAFYTLTDLFLRQLACKTLAWTGRSPLLAVIGSSSTWKEQQLELYNAKQQDAMSAKELIPEKWFDFTELKNEYQAGITACVLTDGSLGDTFVNPTL